MKWYNKVIYNLKAIFNKKYREIAIKHELQQQYQGVCFDWKEVNKEYNKI